MRPPRRLSHYCAGTTTPTTSISCTIVWTMGATTLGASSAHPRPQPWTGNNDDAGQTGEKNHADVYDDNSQTTRVSTRSIRLDGASTLRTRTGRLDGFDFESGSHRCMSNSRDSLTCSGPPNTLRRNDGDGDEKTCAVDEHTCTPSTPTPAVPVNYLHLFFQDDVKQQTQSNSVPLPTCRRVQSCSTPPLSPPATSERFSHAAKSPRNEPVHSTHDLPDSPPPSPRLLHSGSPPSPTPTPSPLPLPKIRVVVQPKARPSAPLRTTSAALNSAGTGSVGSGMLLARGRSTRLGSSGSSSLRAGGSRSDAAFNNTTAGRIAVSAGTRRRSGGAEGHRRRKAERRAALVEDDSGRDDKVQDGDEEGGDDAEGPSVNVFATDERFVSLPAMRRARRLDAALTSPSISSSHGLNSNLPDYTLNLHRHRSKSILVADKWRLFALGRANALRLESAGVGGGGYWVEMPGKEVVCAYLEG